MSTIFACQLVVNCTIRKVHNILRVVRILGFLVFIFGLGEVDFQLLNPCGQGGYSLINTLNCVIGFSDLVRKHAQLLKKELLHLVLQALQVTSQKRYIVWHG